MRLRACQREISLVREIIPSVVRELHRREITVFFSFFLSLSGH
jgi:hypothetical protein